jgi:phosphoenolpyruvate carboxylase
MFLKLVIPIGLLTQFSARKLLLIKKMCQLGRTFLLRCLSGMNIVQLVCLLGMDHFAGNPQVTPEVTRDVCLLARLMAANLYFGQIEDLMFEVEQQ